MKKKTFGGELIESAEEALAYSEGKITLGSSKMALPEDPQIFSQREIKAIREKLNYSQPIFAKFLGVTDKALKAWEQGISKPNGSALRLLSIAKKSPEFFQKIILDSSKKSKRA